MSDRATATTPRGETCLTINGQPHRLCLTLGALAQIETTLGAANLSALQDRLKDPSLKDILLILHALLGGGGAALTLDMLKSSDIDIAEAIRAIAAAFKVLGSGSSHARPAATEE